MKISVWRTTSIAISAVTIVALAGGCGTSTNEEAGPEPSLPTANFEAVNVPGTTALAASNVDLEKYGYEEQEYYSSGTGCTYDIVPDSLRTAEESECDVPYTTRMIVRKPSDPSKFNGTLVAEMYNVTTGQDVDFVWAATHDYVMSSGYAEVSITTQQTSATAGGGQPGRDGVSALRAWSPERYGNLNLLTPGDPQTEDAISWDAFGQTIRGLREHSSVDPLAGLDVKHVIAAGESQSAGRLSTYYNSIDPIHKVIDGALFYDAASSLREDSATKAISVASEIGITLPGGGVPTPDSENYRRWEIAGAAHLSEPEITSVIDPLILRDGLLKGPDSNPTPLTGLIRGCSGAPLWSKVPNAYVVSAALDSVNKWVADGTAAPTAPRLELGTTADGQATYAKSSDGSTLGGIRLADYLYGDYISTGGGNQGPGFCGLTGTHTELTDEQLAVRYPDVDSYIRDASALTEANVENGFILPDAAEKERALVDAVAERLRAVQ